MRSSIWDHDVHQITPVSRPVSLASQQRLFALPAYKAPERLERRWELRSKFPAGDASLSSAPGVALL